MIAWVYMLECGDGSLYTGWTTDPAKRLKAHQSGKGSRYTRAHLPVTMVALKACSSRQQAQQLEPQLKKLSRQEKLEWVKSHPFAG